MTQGVSPHEDHRKIEIFECIFVGDVAHSSEDMVKLVDFVIATIAINVVVVVLALSSKITNGA